MYIICLYPFIELVSKFVIICIHILCTHQYMYFRKKENALTTMVRNQVIHVF